MALASVACKPVASNDPVIRAAQEQLNEIRDISRKGGPTSAKCAGAKVWIRELGATPGGAALRSQLESLCGREAPIASASASLARAGMARAESRSAAMDCAEARLSLEDLATHSAEDEVKRLRERYHALCE
jgi:hypothetical protein